MKSLVLALLSLACYVIHTMAVCHFGRPKRHVHVFHGLLRVWLVILIVTYSVTPSNLWVLPHSPSEEFTVLGLIYSAACLVLGAFSYMALFYGLNGGFSTSLLLELWKRSPSGLTTQDILDLFHDPSGTDKIYAWRLPRLTECGYLTTDPASARIRLTPKGRTAARLGRLMKWFLHLGEGG